MKSLTMKNVHLLPGVIGKTQRFRTPIRIKKCRVTLCYIRRYTAVGEGKSDTSAFSKALKLLVKKVLKPFVRKVHYGPGTNGAHCVALRNRFCYEDIRHDHYAEGYGDDSAQKAEDDAWYNLLEVLSRKDIIQVLRHGYNETRVDSNTLGPRCLGF